MYQKLPVGADIFENLRKQDFYYIDKTNFIRDLLMNRGVVNLFTRPRRFGKTLNMSMLQAFFEIGKDHQDLFAGLAISQEEILCREHMNRYPVIFLTLKSVEGKTFEDALKMLAFQLADECIRLSFVGESLSMDEDLRRTFMLIKARKATAEELSSALKVLSRMLDAYYGEKVVLLIDEYDVPLDKAFHNGYYDKMMAFLRLFLGEGLKTNNALAFAVVTGCLRISKESIFTGLNNLKIHTIMDNRYDEYFGFKDEEVKKILGDYGLVSSYEDMRAWYNGYRFGRRDIYCPWDIVNHVDMLRDNPNAYPKAYWNNTSSNELVKRFIDKADAATRHEIEQLIAGACVDKRIRETVTYAEIDESIDNLWSVLLLTGYLTRKPQPPGPEDQPVKLIIPNREVRSIFIEKIQKWFEEKIQNKGNREGLEKLTQAFLEGDCDVIGEVLRSQLRTTISYYDSYEGYYHGFLTGLLKGCGTWGVSSNRESGDGRSDILIVTDDAATGILIEVKRARSLDDIPYQCERALKQIREKNYEDAFLERGITKTKIYGIAFWKKSCGVTCKQ